MASTRSAEEEVLGLRLLRGLAETPYACSTLSALNGGSANYLFRGVLISPLPADPGHEPAGIVRTIIVKHFEEFLAVSRSFKIDISRCLFEAAILEVLETLSSASGPVFRTPRLYHFDRETYTQVHQDFAEAVNLTSVLTSPGVSRDFVTYIFREVGSGLRTFHDWATEPAQVELWSGIGRNEPMRKLKYDVTYGCFLRMLENFPRLLGGCRGTLEDIRDAARAEFEKTDRREGGNWGMVHGDFWSGNVLLNRPSEESPSSASGRQLVLIDWELAQFGHRAYDLGQMIGDLCEMQTVDQIKSAAWAIEGFVDGYGSMDDELACRTIVHAGVHLANCYVRRPSIRSDRIAGVMEAARDLILRGWERDRVWIRASMLASLVEHP